MFFYGEKVFCFMLWHLSLIPKVNPLQPNILCLEKLFFYCFFLLYRPSEDAKKSLMIFFSKIVDFVEMRPYGLIGHQKCIFGNIKNIR